MHVLLLHPQADRKAGCLGQDHNTDKLDSFAQETSTPETARPVRKKRTPTARTAPSQPDMEESG